MTINSYLGDWVRAWRRMTGGRWLPLALVPVVVGLDAALARTAFHPVRTALLDEPAHLLTTAVVLLSLGPRWCARRPGHVAVALAATVLIDLDHLPRLLGPDGDVAGSRPPTHSLVTVVVLVGLALLLPRRTRVRAVLLAVAVGVGLHLVRDLTTGPGLPLGWPVEGSDVRLPYVLGPALLVVVAVTRITRLDE